jgi:hypothetical protein
MLLLLLGRLRQLLCAREHVPMLLLQPAYGVHRVKGGAPLPLLQQRSICTTRGVRASTESASWGQSARHQRHAGSC